ncbi:hypothetical protein F5B22DRAFT_658343 [Xylaria bambusicola]|uniref:uncharacterized protein n=1 Tax=Xylaria bambusicola TaxID=326684 RepID=UPI0020088D2F|nr:uncharacterized protein F5B22DRAFT_658343 [Xylaria bambusicola]KAI0525515.1 hypothetical protein F5B22DRAFT_658343 [Xylaria bambusicola]
MRYGQNGANNLGQYRVGGLGHGSGSSSFNRNVTGTGYKGRNFDPNFHSRRNEGRESGYKGKNFDPNYYNRRGLGVDTINNFVRNNLGQRNSREGYQGRNFNPNYQNRGDRGPQNPFHQSHPGHIDRCQCTALPLLFLSNFSEKVLHTLQADRDGDQNMCYCGQPGGAQCFHTITELYQNSLVNAAELQTELIKLLEFLMSDNEKDQAYIRGALGLFLKDNPDSILENVVEAMGAVHIAETEDPENDLNEFSL